MVYLGNGKSYSNMTNRKICGLICNVAIITFNKVVFQLFLQSKRQSQTVENIQSYIAVLKMKTIISQEGMI